MRPYLNRSGDSGVLAYEVRADSIIVRFVETGTYRYDYERPGKTHVERMKELARAGQGLATYITQHVRDNFAAKVA